MTDPIRAALAEPAPPAEGEVGKLVAALNKAVDGAMAMGWEDSAQAIIRAADLLKQRHPQPAPPAEGEVAELVKWLRSRAGIPASPDFPAVIAYLTRAADLLEQRHHAPVPVPVSERPWERDGWCDDQGRCWLRGKVVGDWRLLDPTNSGVPQLKFCFSHSLPFHALPLPAGEVAA